MVKQVKIVKQIVKPIVKQNVKQIVEQNTISIIFKIYVLILNCETKLDLYFQYKYKKCNLCKVKKMYFFYTFKMKILYIFFELINRKKLKWNNL